MINRSSGWDYRVVYFPETEEYVVCEVYFNKKGKPESYCDLNSSGDTLEECREDVEMCEEATYKPILIFENDKFIK